MREGLMHALRVADFGRAAYRGPLLVALWLLTSAGLHPALAADRPDSKSEAGFRALVEKHQREALLGVADYLARHPDADDAEAAAQWLFETAVTQGLEAEVVTPAEEFLKRRGLDQPSISLAQQALCVGLARTGKRAEALAVFDAFLKGVHFQSPFRSLELAGMLAAQARMAGDLAAARAIYERVAAAYPLNAQITQIVEGRIVRQELIGQPAPRLTAGDIDGKHADLAEYAGKVVLVDFWATNCAPCLAEFPNLKQLYKEHRERGLEIVGVSFDDGPETVQAYLSRAKLPWRMVMNDSPEGVISQRFKTRTIPALFVIDRKGQIAQVDVRGNDLRAVVEKLLKE
jgi:peroxiredoxin